MKWKYLYFIYIMLMIFSAPYAMDLLEKQNDDDSLVKERCAIPHTVPRTQPITIEDFPDILLLEIFSFFNQNNILPASLTCKRWQRLMDDNQLWKGYAKRACIIREGQSRKRNYKELVKDHCIPSFTELGSLNLGKISQPLAINFDGSVVVGFGIDGATTPGVARAFRWTTEKGMESLGILNDSMANGVSCDGSVIVGSVHDVERGNLRAFRWTDEEGLKFLENFNYNIKTIPHGINSDASVVVGDAEDSETSKIFRWTSEKGMEFLEISDIGKKVCVSCMSLNGLVVVGNTYDDTVPHTTRAFRWTEEKGVEFLDNQHNNFRTHADGISFDGSIIVGLSHQVMTRPQHTMRPFRWAEEKGIELLKNANNEIMAWACCTNMDGSVIVGNMYKNGLEGIEEPFRWTAEQGIESIERLLARKSCLPFDFILKKVTSITPNGAVLIGVGSYTNKLEDEIAWRAVISRGNLF